MITTAQKYKLYILEGHWKHMDRVRMWEICSEMLDNLDEKQQERVMDVMFQLRSTFNGDQRKTVFGGKVGKGGGHIEVMEAIKQSKFYNK